MRSAMRRASAATAGDTSAGTRETFEDVVAVLVLGHVEAFDAAVMAARGDHRDLALEPNERLDDRGLTADRAPGRGGIVAGLRSVAWPLPS